MCIKDKSCIIELRSQDGEKLGPTNSETSKVRFSINMREAFRLHPENDSGMWNVKVASFSLHQPNGINNSCGSIDISCEQLTSPYLFSSRNIPKLVLGTAKINVYGDVDPRSVSTEAKQDTDPVEVRIGSHFCIRDNESYWNTCNVGLNDWIINIDPSLDGLGSLVSTYPSDNVLEDWVLRLQIKPYETHDYK